jgi:hypothetical protein
MIPLVPFSRFVAIHGAMDIDAIDALAKKHPILVTLHVFQESHGHLSSLFSYLSASVCAFSARSI